MRYSVDFRQRAVGLANEEKNKAKACRIMRIGRSTLDRWLALDDLTPQKPGPKQPWKLDPERLKAHVDADAEAYLDERARDLGVSTHAVHYGLKRLGLTRKKNDTLPPAQ